MKTQRDIQGLPPRVFQYWTWVSPYYLVKSVLKQLIYIKKVGHYAQKKNRTTIQTVQSNFIVKTVHWNFRKCWNMLSMSEDPGKCMQNACKMHAFCCKETLPVKTAKKTSVSFHLRGHSEQFLFFLFLGFFAKKWLFCSFFDIKCHFYHNRSGNK